MRQRVNQLIIIMKALRYFHVLRSEDVIHISILLHASKKRPQKANVRRRWWQTLKKCWPTFKIKIAKCPEKEFFLVN